MTIAMIWAQDRRGVIGTGTAMAWRVPADMRFFKESTMGHPVIMGRRSWQALGSKPLPGRTNIVITSQPDFTAEGATVAAGLEEAIDVARSLDELVWITGGGRVYAQGLPLADELVVTDLDLTVPDQPGLVYAPTIDPKVWARDDSGSDSQWREISGDARWRVSRYRRR